MIKLGIGYSLKSDNSNWSAREGSLVVLKSGDGIIQVNNDKGKPVILIVLGLVCNKIQAWTVNLARKGGEPEDEGREVILDDQYDDWNQQSWNDVVSDCSKTVKPSKLRS
ncbi:hypothetical protein OVS_00710 [Mycoplasma ovis str. Michigan]|uniref:Uncharacterized protein n=1 Tax=Mycoplasma ovis str. Michigan TaxID=1415773 RepID=A0ABM5P0Z2_9MOLU|nr:hypothetical protein [Mycoplasma ovis]AHC40132.1 hypothetical protein OVS_00710 [Mycoplasma ovis str. Michigan]